MSTKRKTQPAAAETDTGGGTTAGRVPQWAKGGAGNTQFLSWIKDAEHGNANAQVIVDGLFLAANCRGREHNYAESMLYQEFAIGIARYTGLDQPTQTPQPMTRAAVSGG